MSGRKHAYDLYEDIRDRCNGEIYLGILGPVRTGKSTFISRFMEELVLPNMEDPAARMRAMDELPQSSGGKTITTTEPKFVPSEAALIRVGGEVQAKVRLIDCVGYMVDGAVGHMEGEAERMVKTPWFEEPIPFTQAAEIGTDKVMTEHSTIGLVITTDGSVGELPRDAYLEAEQKTIHSLKETGKPFLVLVNSRKPYSEEAKGVAARIAQEEGVRTMTVNCEQLRKEDILDILEEVLYEFPITSIEFHGPRWMESLPKDHPLRANLIERLGAVSERCTTLRDVSEGKAELGSDYLKKSRIEKLGLSDGVVKVELEPKEQYYYQILTETVGEEVKDPTQLMEKLKDYGAMKRQYEKVLDAMESVRIRGYGVALPEREEITLEQPEIIKQGNKYGVKIRALSPSIHMIRANVETEIAPIVGTKEQAEDLIGFITNSGAGETMWETNIFGKSVEQMVNDGIQSKIAMIGPESQEKLQDCMKKIVNEANGGMVCIII